MMSLRKNTCAFFTTALLFSYSVSAKNPLDSLQNTSDSALCKMDLTFHNAVKINFAALLFNNISLQYERQINDHWSIQMGAGFKWGGDIPKVVGLGDFLISSNTTGLRGYAFAPEARYYFNMCDGAHPMTGLYGGIYSKMTRLYDDLGFHFWSGEELIDVTGYGNMHELGIGLQLGYQFTIKRHLLIDLMFMGPRTSQIWLNLELDSDYAGEIIPLIEQEINKKLEYFGMDPISIPSSASTQVKFGFNNFRYVVSVGYLF
jgi:hypothetical protein